MRDLVLGIDVGGTNVKLGIVDKKGAISARSSMPTKSYNRNRNQLIAAIFSHVRNFLNDFSVPLSRISGIGIGLPGPVDPFKGKVIFLPNVPGWKNVPLRDIFQKEFRVPVMIENDVNMITLGEWKFGAGKGYSDLICVTLGTGVGGGLIFNGRLYRGPGFAAGEIGHMPLNEQGPDCNCGGFGCFERYVGNSRLFKNIDQMFGTRDMRIQEVNALAAKGDPMALRFFAETGEKIGNGLVGVVNLLNPPLIIIGGGVSNNHKYLFPAIKKVIARRAMKVQGAMVKIARSRLIDDAGVLGARVLLTEGLGRS